MALREKKKKLLPNNLTMWDSFSLLGPFTETEATALPLFSLSHTHKMERKRQPRTNHTAADDMLIHTRVMANHPSPPPPNLPHTSTRTSTHNQEVLQGSTLDSLIIMKMGLFPWAPSILINKPFVCSSAPPDKIAWEEILRPKTNYRARRHH